MKITLTRAYGGRQEFPGGGISRFVSLMFSDGTNHVRKSAKVSCTTAICGGDDLDNQITYQIIRAFREAEKDFAFMKYGDAWKAHSTGESSFTGNLTEEEKEIVGQARTLLKAQAHEH